MGDLMAPMHLIVILAIVLVIFGPGKLPELGAGLGKAIGNFKKGLSEGEQQAIDTRRAVEAKPENPRENASTLAR